MNSYEQAAKLVLSNRIKELNTCIIKAAEGMHYPDPETQQYIDIVVQQRDDLLEKMKNISEE